MSNVLRIECFGNNCIAVMGCPISLMLWHMFASDDEREECLGCIRVDNDKKQFIEDFKKFDNKMKDFQGLELFKNCTDLKGCNDSGLPEFGSIYLVDKEDINEKKMRSKEKETS